jgi:hypothetical protein
MDVVKLVAIGPIVFRVVDFEVTVWWYTRVWLVPLTSDSVNLRTIRVVWDLSLCRVHWLQGILSL